MLFAAYAATLGIDAADGVRYGGEEPHFLIAAASIAEDGGVGLAEEYEARTWERWQRALTKVDEEAPRVKLQAQASAGRTREEMKEKAEQVRREVRQSPAVGAEATDRYPS